MCVGAFQKFAATETDTDAAEDFCRRLREKPWAKSSTFVYIVESNYGGTPKAAEIIRRLIKNRPSIAYGEDIHGKHRPGVWVTHEYKERFVQFLQNILRMGSLRFHDDIVSLKEPDVVRQLIITKLRNFRRIYKKVSASGSSASFSESTKSSKLTGKGKGQTDDATMALLECLFFLTETLKSPHYMNLFSLNPIASAPSKVQMKYNPRTGREEMYLEKTSEEKSLVRSAIAAGGNRPV